ncbi:UNVERIFIED_CONTAM: hypothetical protein K2H54_044647, partial [Gekko kuhli]
IQSKRYSYLDSPRDLYTIIDSNLPAANGIIHIVNTLRTIPSLENLGNPQKTIGEILASLEIASRFETILEGINKLQELVKYHIYTAAVVTVERLIVMPHIMTMANQILTVNITKDGRILLGDPGVALNKRNILASNGVIHTLDGIFIPPSIIPILPHRCNEQQYKAVAGNRHSKASAAIYGMKQHRGIVK